MNIRKSLFGLALAAFVLALCIPGTATAGEQLALTFQEHYNIITGERDDSYTGTMDITLRKWDMSDPNHYNPPTQVGSRGEIKIRQFYYHGPLDVGMYPAALIYFPGIVSALETLPDEPVGDPGHGINKGVGPNIDSATLYIHGSAWSADPVTPAPVYLEVSMVTPNAQMWTEDDTGWLINGATRPRTNAEYRYYDSPTPVAWASPHIEEHRDGDPANNAQGTAGDHGPLVDAYMMDGDPWKGIEVPALNVLPIINDWVAGTYANQGFHIDMGVNYWDADYEMSVNLITKEGADGEYSENPPPAGTELDWSPKLVIYYSYNGNVTADAGPDMGEVGDADPRVKPGETVTLDASASTPVFAYSPLTQYKWSWNYGGAQYSITSPNDQSSAQFFEMLATTDNITLVASDDLGQSGTDSAKIKVTARIPGDIDGSGVVDLGDFVILKNHFGQHN